MARNEITGYPEPDDHGPLFTRQGDTGTRGQGVPVSPSPHPLVSPSCSLPKAVDISAADSGRRRQRILQYLKNFGPTTIHEFCTACSSGEVTVYAHQVSGRFTDMAGRDGFLRVIGQKPHPVSGASCNIYEITERGLAELQRMKTQRTRRHP